MLNGALGSPIYQESALWVLSCLFIAGLIVYLLRQKNYYFVVSWASIKSWLIVGPILFVLLGLPEPWPLVVLTLIAILGAKVFFQLMGMYHRSNFVLVCYAGIWALGWTIYAGREDLYNLLPMIVLGLCCFIPLFRNSFKRMIQYISLTLLAFVFLGWSFMHLGLIMRFENGIYQAMYLIILTEFCDNTNLALSRYLGKFKLFDRIDHKRSLSSTLVSAALTILLAFLMRNLLPDSKADSSQMYWLATGIVASIGGMFGDLIMTVVRRDAGIRITGAFVLGRGDFLHRMDRLIFVAPIYFYVTKFLLR